MSEINPVDELQVDVLAVGAHPDDVEIGCGGTLALLAEQGYRVGIVDLTDGEPTPGCPHPEVRLMEAQQAAQILGVVVRRTLSLPNRQLMDCFEARIALAKEIRRLRPRLVLGIGAGTPTASPDHLQAREITTAAVFYARLSKWEHHFEGLPPHTVGGFWHYFLAFRHLTPPAEYPVVVDISRTIEKKIAAIRAYKSQFSGEKAHFPERVRIFNQQQGLSAGFSAGEVLSPTTPLGIRDLMGFIFGR
ncbi:MAG: PIG-L family deacetylase [Thermoguttaceae bacterium]|nr:PIG-L family deacetylase [Thermoguttaceae bacterium]MDW8077963.1 PIG-L family deacetylase [Thermoguttaceae bacterium]